MPTPFALLGMHMEKSAMLQRAVDGVWNATAKPIGNAVGNVAKGVGNVAGGAAKGAWNAASMPFHALGAGIGGALSGVAKGGLGGAVQGAWDGASDAFATDVKDYADGAGQAFKGIGQTAGGAVGFTGRALASPITSLYGAATGHGTYQNPSMNGYGIHAAPKPAAPATPAPATPATAAQPVAPPPTFDSLTSGKSAALTPAFAALEKRAGSMLGGAVRGVGQFLTRHAGQAQKAYKTNFQSFYGGLDKAQRAAHPALQARAMRVQSMNPATLGKEFGIGQKRLSAGNFLNNTANRLDEMKLLRPGMHGALTAGAMAVPAVGVGALGYGMMNAGHEAPPAYPDPYRFPPPSDDYQVVKGAAFAMLDKKAGSWLGKLMTSAGRGAQHVAGRLGPKTNLSSSGVTSAKGLPGAGGLFRAGGKVEQAGESVNAFAKDSPGLWKGLNAAGATALGGGALYGSNRMGHASGRQQGLGEGYDAGATAGVDAATQNQPGDPGVMGRILNVFRGQQAGPDAAAVRNLLDQSKEDILQTILRGTTGE